MSCSVKALIANESGQKMEPAIPASFHFSPHNPYLV